MLTQNLGYPRIGSQRELKKVCENYLAGKTGLRNVQTVGKNIRHENWQLQKEAGIDLIPSNDFSFFFQFSVESTSLPLYNIGGKHRALPADCS